jgi:hypothetical protein
MKHTTKRQWRCSAQRGGIYDARVEHTIRSHQTRTREERSDVYLQLKAAKRDIRNDLLNELNTKLDHLYEDYHSSKNSVIDAYWDRINRLVEWHGEEPF